ncbi:hypothetical protein C2G38_808073 [Gigaspora rosea]|uniref:Uncharacterized protein n=1 Tax=Gigaspora rosea TaxID=44941 RepID=A0A397TYT8_9GLOM|nr:hypothetical protein C2G38_808073 [Gigaspora rosea]
MARQRTTTNGTTATITKRTSTIQAGSSMSTVAKARGRKSNVGTVLNTKKSVTNGKSRSRKTIKNDSYRKHEKHNSDDEFYQSDDNRDDIDIEDNVTINTNSNDGSQDMEDLIGLLQSMLILFYFI